MTPMTKKGDQEVAQRRRAIRYFAAALSAATAVIYLLIGFQVVSVLDKSTDQIFGFFATIPYAFGAVLLLRFDRRVFWILGAILQVFVIITYFNLASRRLPAFEFWGILLRIPQLMILIALAYLVFRLPLAQASASDSRGS